MSERQITGCDYPFLPSAAGEGCPRRQLARTPGKLSYRGGPRAAAWSWSHCLDPPTPRFPPPNGSPPHFSYPTPARSRLPAKAATRGHTDADPRWGHAPPGRLVLPIDPLSESGRGLLHVAQLGGYLARQRQRPPRVLARPPHLPPKFASPAPGAPAAARLAHPRGASATLGLAAGRRRVPAPAPDFLPGGPIAFFVESSQVLASAGLAHLLASETSIH